MWTFDLLHKSGLCRLGESFSMTKSELIDFAARQGAPRTVLRLLCDLDGSEEYTCLLDIWPDMPTTDYEIYWNPDDEMHLFSNY